LNPAGLKLIGAKNLEEVLGRSVYTFAPSDLHVALQLRRQRVLQRGIASPVIEFELLRLDGSPVLVESQAVPFVYSGQPAILNLLRDITERKRAEVERAEAGKRERRAREEFTHLLITSQEAERRRIARELHDSLGQNLSIIKSRAHLATQQPTLATGHIEAIERIASEAIDETRSLAHNLRPTHIEHAGLTASLQELVREVSQSSQVRFERRVENVDGIFKGEAATNVYRMVQEGLNNLIKHSQARQAVVTVERDIRAVRLRISDDGVGFDTSEEGKGQGLGLTSISERVRMLGGKLKIESTPGHGTQLAIELPIAEVDNATTVET
jgi:PAS domain S-box-containing protein